MAGYNKQFNEIIHRILTNITPEEGIALHLWASKLLVLKNSTMSRPEKLQNIIQLTKDAKILIPLIKTIFVELKKTGWDESSWKSKLGMGATLWASLIIGKAAAGLALLGGAIAVPLWIVFGTGDEFIKMLIEELKKRMPSM